MFEKTVADHIGRIERCNLLTFFDNRIFVSGNPNYPNNIFWTELTDARYFGDLNYANEGNDLEPVKAMVTSNNALWVFKKNNQANTTAFYHTPTIDKDFGKVYPTSNSNIATGCVSTGINFNDDVVFFSNNGLEAVTGNILSENLLSHRSSLVDNRLLNEVGYEDMQICEYQNYLLCLVNNKIYLADSRQKFQYNNTEWQYEWYVWQIDIEINRMVAMREQVYFYTSNGKIFKLGGNEEQIHSYWTTPDDDLSTTIYLKTTSKRGGLVQFESMNNDNIKLSVRLNNGEFVEHSTLNDNDDYSVYNVKMKKFRTISLKFESNKPFCLMNCTLQGYIGGFIKR